MSRKRSQILLLGRVSLLLAMLIGLAVALSGFQRPGGAQERSEESSVAPDWYVPEVIQPYDGGSDFLIIKDVNPWGCDGSIQALNEMGEPYDVRNASQIPGVNLGEYKVVIISSDQRTSTYNALAANRPALESYVTGGGVLVAHAADLGWNDGHWATSFLPGGVHHGHTYGQLVSILDPSHPIVAGLPGGGVVTDSQLDNWNYSVHGYFTNLPAETTKVIGVTGNPQGQPTYIEYSFGQGHVMATMHTLEWVWPGCGGASLPNATAGRNLLRNELRYALEAAVPPSVEKAFEESALVETLATQQGVVSNAVVSGEFDTVLQFTDFELATIATGPFAGKGFSTGLWQTTLEAVPYDGQWRGTLFFKPGENRIYLKGAVSGGMQGTVEGYLSETVPGSGVYDQYEATWEIGRVGGTTTSMVLNVAGTVAYVSESEFPNTELYVLQAAFEGTIAGDYSGPLSSLLTHVRVASGAPYEGEGFSLWSYVSDHGSGAGWTYDRVTSPGIVALNGLFADPLFGVVSGTLNETSVPRRLLLRIERVDLGLPPMADLVARIWGPIAVSPGQTVDYVIEYGNNQPIGADDVVLVYDLPEVAEYISNTGGGIYISTYHEVVWMLGTLGPFTTGQVTARVRFPWGLPQGEPQDNVVRIGTTSEERDTYSCHLSAFDIDRYLDLQHVTSTEPLAEEDLAAIRSADPGFDDMFNFAAEQGFEYTGMSGKHTAEDGSTYVVAIMSSPGSTDDTLLAIQSGYAGQNTSYLVRVGEAGMEVFDRVGGINYDFASGAADVFGEHQSCASWACTANCIIKEVPGWTLDYTIGLLGKPYKVAWKTANTSWYCVNWPLQSDPQKKAEYREDCLLAIAKDLKEVPGLTEGFQVGMCIMKCGLNRYEHPGFFMCVPGMVKEQCQGWFISYKATYECNDQCKWQLVDKQECLPRPHGWLLESGWCYQESDTEAHCVPEAEQMPNVDEHESVISVARDPNIKYGPQGSVLPGQALEYKVEYENEGEGVAFGVYFSDTLDEDLDASTLAIGPVVSTIDGSVLAGPGTYDATTRTITWLVGEVGPREGGFAEFSVNVRSDAPERTAIINSATVYFPSVPETTPTNPVVVTVSTDVTPPTTTISLDPASPNGANGWYVSPVTVTLTAEDDASGSGVASTEYRLNEGPWEPYAHPLTLSADGITTVEARSTDNAGNVEDPPVAESLRIDRTPPDISITEGVLDGLHWDQAHLERGILTNTATLGLSGNAADSLCLWQVRAVNQGMPPVSQSGNEQTSLSYSLSVPLHVGINNIDVIAEDCAGWEKSIRLQVVYVIPGPYDPRTIGFWYNAVETGKYSRTDFQALLDHVNVVSDVFGLDARNIYGPVTMDNYRGILVPSSSDMQTLQKAQLLGAWLNLVTGRVVVLTPADLSKVKGWAQVVDNTGGSPLTFALNVLMEVEDVDQTHTATRAVYEIAKNLLDAFNNRKIIP
jgi:hypothetical protein